MYTKSQQRFSNLKSSIWETVKNKASSVHNFVRNSFGKKKRKRKQSEFGKYDYY